MASCHIHDALCPAGPGGQSVAAHPRHLRPDPAPHSLLCAVAAVIVKVGFFIIKI